MTQHHFSVSPTIVDIDNELVSLSDAEIERLADRADPHLLGRKPWENATTDERRTYRALEQQARRRHKAELKAKEDAKNAEWQAEQDKRNQAQIDAYKAQCRAAWIGDERSFSAAWPRLLEDWQIEEAKRHMNELHDQVRRRIGSTF